jgi:DNA replication and repair protein RecF
VEFIPEEVYLLKDFPKDRRKFMDKEISKIDKSYMDNLLIYNKLIKQRNELLKSEDVYKEELLFVIDDKISELQVDIIRKRKTFLKEIEKVINEFNTSLNDVYEFEIAYEGCFEEISKDAILSKYKSTLEKDKERRVTSLGVHKDDFKIYINHNDASNFGSQGEQRFIVLLVKLALVNLIKERIKECPILVLDDVFSELDESRKKEVYKIIKEFDQVFITGCNYEEIKEIENIKKYQIKENKIHRIKEEMNDE